MSESRDSNDPRDMMRGMREEAQAEFEREEAGATGGQEHASRAEREGTVPRRDQPDAGSTSRSSREQPDAAREDPATGGGATSAPAEPSGE